MAASMRAKLFLMYSEHCSNKIISSTGILFISTSRIMECALPTMIGVGLSALDEFYLYQHRCSWNSCVWNNDDCMFQYDDIVTKYNKMYRYDKWCCSWWCWWLNIRYKHWHLYILNCSYALTLVIRIINIYIYIYIHK